MTRRATSANPDVEVEVDLLVPEAVSPVPGRRAARLPGHEPHAARSARGLEGALFDADVMRVADFQSSNARGFDLRVAGPAALLVSKLHKISDRAGSPRATDKDAYDVLRLLRGTTAEEVADRIRRLRAEPLSGARHRGGHGLLSLFLRTRERDWFADGRWSCPRSRRPGGSGSLLCGTEQRHPQACRCLDPRCQQGAGSS